HHSRYRKCQLSKASVRFALFTLHFSFCIYGATTMANKIGVIGSGAVGQALANGFIKYGYDVTNGTNDRNKHEELKSNTKGKARIGTFEETAKFGSIVVLAVKGSAAEAALKSAGIANLKEKTVIDTTNPIADAPPVHGVIQY